jgi:hypothetical protein
MRFFYKLISLIFLANFFAFSSNADGHISLSGYQEFFAGSADQTRTTALDNSTGASSNTSFSGFSNGTYTRLVATATTTLDSGIEVTGVLTMAKDTDNGGDSDVESVSTDQNDISFSGGFGTLAVGNTGSAGSMMHNRATTLPPTAEPDGAVLAHFYTGGAGTYGAHDEAGYANDAVKIRYQSNVYEGFSIGLAHTPNLNADGTNASAIDQNGCSVADITGHACYTDMNEVILAYSGEFEGVGISATYGYIEGNTNIRANVMYNDLEATTYTIGLTYGGATIHYKNNDMDASGQVSTETDAGNTKGDALCGVYAIGNFSIGGCKVETSYDETGQSVSNGSTTSLIGVGYNLGGGVSLETAYASIEEKDNGVVDTEVDIIMTKLSFGF